MFQADQGEPVIDSRYLMSWLNPIEKRYLIKQSSLLALAGNETMLRLFLERMLPAKPHSEPINLELPEDINKKAILLTMGERVLRGIANEDITLGQGKIIMDLVEEQKRLLTIQKHDRDMAKILGHSPD